MNWFTRRRSLRPFPTNWTRPSPKCPDTKNKKTSFSIFSVFCLFLSLPLPSPFFHSHGSKFFFTGDLIRFNFTIRKILIQIEWKSERYFFLSDFFRLPQKIPRTISWKSKNSCHHLNLTNSSIIREQQLQRPRLAVSRNSQQPFGFRQKSWAIFLARNLNSIFHCRAIPFKKIHSNEKKKKADCVKILSDLQHPFWKESQEILNLPANKLNRHVQTVTYGLLCWKKLLLLWFWTNHLSVLVAVCHWCGRIIQFSCCCCYVECV
jgi:hypothetical protein